MDPQASVNGAGNALHDYQVQMMLLEQQNKKRLMMSRQETGFPTNMEGSLYLPLGPEGRPFMETLSDWSTEYMSEYIVNQNHEM